MINPSLVFKMITAGDGNVGKTTMLRKYVDDKFSFGTKMTIGANMYHKVLTLEDGIVVSLQLWDFGGQERFRFFLDTFVRGASGAILMYDLTDRKTFDNLPNWEIIARKYDPTLPIMLVGGKNDLENEIEVDDNEALEFVEKYNCRGFYRTSALTGFNINEVFEILTNIVREYNGLSEANQSMEI